MSDVTSITWGPCFKCGQPITGYFVLLGSERYHYGCLPVAVPCLSCHALQQHIAALEDAIRAGARDNTELSRKLARREERIVALEQEVARLRAIVVEAIQWRLPEELVRRAKAALAPPAGEEESRCSS